MSNVSTALDRVRPLVRVRQFREFTSDAVAPADLDAIVDAGRWSGSSSNEQPWRFVVIRGAATLRQLAEAGQPQTRPLTTATAAVAIVLPDERERAISRAFDEGRAAERMLDAASLLGLGAGICWILPDVRPAVAAILALPPDRFVRTFVAIGHPTEQALKPKAAAGQARLPRSEMVFEERWPAS